MVEATNTRVAARLGLGLAAVLGFLLTVPFALAFNEAYDSGRAGVLPARVGDWVRDRGLLGADAAAIYDRYGVLYLLALGLATVSFVLVVRPVAAGTRALVAGLLILCAGVLLDYVVPNDYVGAFGFLLELIGFVVVAVAVGLIVRQRSGRLAAMAATLAVVACMAVGGVLTGHVPSGPGLTILAGALVVGLSGSVSRSLTRSGSPGAAPAAPS